LFLKKIKPGSVSEAGDRNHMPLIL